MCLSIVLNSNFKLTHFICFIQLFLLLLPNVVGVWVLFFMFLMVLAQCGLCLHVFDHFKWWAQVSQDLVCESDFCEGWIESLYIRRTFGLHSARHFRLLSTGESFNELIEWHFFSRPCGNCKVKFLTAESGLWLGIFMGEFFPPPYPRPK